MIRLIAFVIRLALESLWVWEPSGHYWTASQLTVVCIHYGWTVLHLSAAFDWISVVCSSHLYEFRGQRRVVADRLLRSLRPKDVVIVASDFCTQHGYLTETERHIGGRFSLTADRIDNGDSSIQVSCGHVLFLGDTSFCQRKRHQSTWWSRHCQYVGLRLITLPLATGGMD